MKITVYGSGYVGLVVAACFAEAGYQVLCMDVDEEKIHSLQRGIIPIYEPGLEQLICSAQTNQALAFTTDAKQAVKHGEFQFIAVGTPMSSDGMADLQYVLSVASTIAEHMTDYTIIIDKSTVPIGTADKVRDQIQLGLIQRGKFIPFDVVSNPEFLKEGAAINDFTHPHRIILGIDNPHVEEKLRRLYSVFNPENNRIICMDTRSAELTKYAANALLATKISFINEMANLAEKVGADIEKVRLGIGADPRIGKHFIHAGCGYGGSCFGKDIQALIHTAHSYESSVDILQAVEKVNLRQKQLVVQKILDHFKGDIANKKFAIWGLAFKPETDDMRDAPSVVVLNALWENGAMVQVFDPQAQGEAQKYFKNQNKIVYGAHPEEVLKGASALVVLTEWKIFKNPNFTKIKESLLDPVIFDGRNIYQTDFLAKMGITYYGIGRGAQLGSSKHKISAGEKVPTKSRAHCEDLADEN